MISNFPVREVIQGIMNQCKDYRFVGCNECFLHSEPVAVLIVLFHLFGLIRFAMPFFPYSYMGYGKQSLDNLRVLDPIILYVDSKLFRRIQYTYSLLDKGPSTTGNSL